MKNYLLALLIFIGYLSPIQSVFASEDEHEGEEGISKIDNNMAKKVGVETAYLASKTLNQTIPVYGSTTIGAEQLFQVGARYNGVIKTINSTVGDKVKKGDLLARDTLLRIVQRDSNQDKIERAQSFLDAMDTPKVMNLKD